MIPATAMPMLDPASLMTASALAIASSGALLMAARRPGRAQDVGVIWGASMVTGACGFFVAALAQDTPWIADGIGTALFLAGVSLSWVGARIFTGRQGWTWSAAAGPLLWLVTLPIQHGPASGWPSIWVALACCIGIVYTAGIALELARDRLEYLPSRNLALALLAIHLAVYVTRGSMALAAPARRVWPEDLVVVLTLEGLVHAIGMAFLMLAMLKERTELRSVEQLRRLSLQDGLTGIGNRRHFDEQLALEIRRAARRGAPIALLMIDVDHFKAFNDRLGHQEGDECLKAVAKRLTLSSRRPGDLLARYGGEEFVHLLPDTDLDGALHLAELSRASIEALRIPNPGLPGSPGAIITASIGAAALVPNEGQKSARYLIHLADKAMYEAKASGRNAIRACVYDRVP